MRDSTTPSYGYRGPAGAGYEGADSLLSAQQATGYAYMSDFGSTGQYGQPPRIPTLPSSENPMSTTGIPPLRIPSLAETAASAQGHSYSASYTSPQSASHNNQSFWDPTRAARADQNRPPTSQWPVLPALDTSVTRQRSGTINTLSSRSDAFPSHVPSRPWSSSASSATSSSSGASGTHYNNPPFPTLASPYYPAQSPTQRNIDAASSPTAHPGGSPEYFTSTSYHRSSVRHGGADQGGFSGSPTLPTPTSPAYLTNATSSSQWSSQYGRAGVDRVQPNLQPISTYPLPPSASSASPPPSSSGTQASQMEYWNRR